MQAMVGREAMLSSVGPVISVDMSKSHHWLVVVSKKHDVVHVSCVDCDDAREYPYRHLEPLKLWLESQTDYQVLSWVTCDGD